MCICPVGLNGSSCESIVVENKVNAKLHYCFMYVRHKFVWIQIALLFCLIIVNNIYVMVLLQYLKLSWEMIKGLDLERYSICLNI